MINFKHVFNLNSFNIRQIKKNKWYLKQQTKLSNFHYKNCSEYRKISNTLFNSNKKYKLEQMPFIHTSLFKNFNLKSKTISPITQIYSSSGTSGKKLSNINVDHKTSLLQSKALKKIFNDFFKKKYKYIFLIDSKKNFYQKNKFSAKFLAMKGFSHLVEKTFFLKKTDGNLKLKILIDFLKKNLDEPFILFGFTSQIWFELILYMKKENIIFNKNNGIVIHGGGWKKMKDKSVSKIKLYSEIYKYLGVKHIHNYYGMVEQTGSIFFECEKGYYHSSIFSEIFIRDTGLNLSKNGEQGLIQLLSLLPLSYPGHNILTEDLGKIVGVDDCKCGRLGKYFLVDGRVANVDVRGCSDAE